MKKNYPTGKFKNPLLTPEWKGKYKLKLQNFKETVMMETMCQKPWNAT